MSENKSNPVGAEQPGKWEGIPSDFAPKNPGYGAPHKRRMKRSAQSSVLKSEHGSMATAAAAAAEPNNRNERGGSTGTASVITHHADDHTDPAVSGTPILDEQSYEEEHTRKSETESLLGEKSPTLENNEMSSSVEGNEMTEKDMTGFSDSKDLANELAAVGDESDEEDEYNAATRENNLSVDLSQSSRSISSDGAMDAAGEAENDIVSSMDAESNQNPEANLDEILAERDSLKKKVESQDERMEAMGRENALLKEQLESCREIISACEAEIATLKKTTVKANSSADVGTNTETPAGQIWQQVSYPRKDDNEQELISFKIPVRFIQPFLVLAKDLYFDFAEAVNEGPMSGSLAGMAYFFQNWARAVIAFLATPFWTLMSFSMYLTVQHEKNLWMQANALTRKQLLGHVSDAAGEWNWDMIFVIGSVMLLYYRHI
ncbi:hypothetical protein THARTR1_09235 [Trichoderma harzianum]|uniref:Uncharacterized protein n=1 Tax=Trichoderma harzianum TaxID=5544 RepID=A0A2K0TWY2_TRIHA|nr:hypothetical protein THARTR1_09235 [Trichoderma harzianum]